MERLTNEVLDNAISVYKTTLEITADNGENCYSALDKATFEFLKELKQYRDAEEQGLLLRLPCKVGDAVYSYCSCFGILEYEVDSIVMTEDEIIYQCSAYSEPIGDCPSECLDEIEVDISDFGKTVFLTKEEAEQALKEGVSNG